MTEQQQAEAVEGALRGDRQCRICDRWYSSVEGTRTFTCGKYRCHEMYINMCLGFPITNT